MSVLVLLSTRGSLPSVRPSVAIACNGNDVRSCACTRVTPRGVAYTHEKDAHHVGNAGHPRPTPRSCGRRVLTPLLGAAAAVRRRRRRCCRSVGVETIGGRCVELDAEEISLVSRAVAVVASVTVLGFVGKTISASFYFVRFFYLRYITHTHTHTYRPDRNCELAFCPFFLSPPRLEFASSGILNLRTLP